MSQLHLLNKDGEGEMWLKPQKARQEVIPHFDNSDLSCGPLLGVEFGQWFLRWLRCC